MGLRPEILSSGVIEFCVLRNWDTETPRKKGKATQRMNIRALAFNKKSSFVYQGDGTIEMGEEPLMSRTEKDYAAG